MVSYSFKRRFIVPISRGLGIPYQIDDIVVPTDTPKSQTIRAIGKRRHASPGNTLQLYTAMRTKQCRLIGEAVCVDVIPMVIWVTEKAFAVQRGKLLLNPKETQLFAQQDGFADADDMAAFWRAEHKGIDKFEGLMISWRAIPNG